MELAALPRSIARYERNSSASMLSGACCRAAFDLGVGAGQKVLGKGDREQCLRVDEGAGLRKAPDVGERDRRDRHVLLFDAVTLPPDLAQALGEKAGGSLVSKAWRVVKVTDLGDLLRRLAHLFAELAACGGGKRLAHDVKLACW